MLKTNWVLAAMAGGVVVPGAGVLAQTMAGSPYRVADFPLGSAVTPPRVYTNMGLFQSLGDLAVFIAAGPAESGRELWVTDGTGAGTRLLKELDPRAGRDLAPWAVLGYTAGGVRRAAFLGRDEVGLILTDTNGSDAGTRLVRVPEVGADSVLWGAFNGAVAGKPLIFVQGAARQWWVLDGAEVRPIGGPRAYIGSPGPIPVAQTPTRSYLISRNENLNWVLWRTDGTAAGTALVGGYGETLQNLGSYATLGERVFLTRTSPQGVTSLMTVDPGADAAREVSLPEGFTLGSSAGLAVSPDGSGVLVGAREGTLACDVIEESFSLFTTAFSVASPSYFQQDSLPRVLHNPSGDRTLMTVRTAAGARELWGTDGTPGGSQRLAAASVATLGAVDGRYFFTIGDPNTSVSEVWATDGTPSGTSRLSSMTPDRDTLGTADIHWPYSATVGDRLIVKPRVVRTADQGLLNIFSADGGMTAVEPGPGVPIQRGSVAGTPVRAGGTVLLPIADTVAGVRLGVTEGTAATTRAAVPNLFPSLDTLTGLGDLAWFGVRAEGGGVQVWRTDGSEAGTLAAGTTRLSNSEPGPFIAGGDGVLTSSGGLYTSNGAAGSLRPLAGATGAGVPGEDGAGRIYHAYKRSSSSVRLVRVDPGSGAVTVLADLQSSVFDPVLTPAAGAMYITAFDGGGWRLWRSAGTSETTAPVLGEERLAAGSTAVAAGRIVFARTQGGGSVLSTEDGFGGPLVALGSFASIGDLVSYGEGAVFLADDGEHGTEPWITDGTAAGTHMIAETVPGPRGAAGRSFDGERDADGGPHLFAGRDRCYFWVADDTLAAHAWTTDGTAVGTHRLGRLPDEVRQLPTSPTDFVESGGLVYFRGWTPERGVDLYAVRLCDADFTGDGFLDFFDYGGFLDAFEAGTPDADFNGDGFLDFFDYDAFVGAFERGC